MNTIRLIFAILFNILYFTTAQAQSLYCPEHSQYIKIGMSADQVVQACGQPLTKQKKKNTQIKIDYLKIYMQNRQKKFYEALDDTFLQVFKKDKTITGLLYRSNNLLATIPNTP